MIKSRPRLDAVRQFKQPRAARTYRALLEAAERVFARRGFDAAQSPEIAAEAGVSTGAFYRYFLDKRQAFVEMIANHLQRAHDEVMAKLTPDRFTGTEVRQAIDVAIEILFAHVRRHADLERVLVDMSLRDRQVERLRAEFENLGVESLAALIQQLIPVEIAPHPRAAAKVIYLASIEVAVERAGLRSTVGPPISDGEVKRALGDMIERYLFLAPPAAPPSRPGRPGGRRRGR